jgi:glycosyltransferase involved in cell wall biosynthesis
MPDQERGSRMRLACIDLVNPGWTAGAVYYKNLFSALRQLDDVDRPGIVLAARPSKGDGGHDLYRALADEVVEIPAAPRRGIARLGRRVERRLGLKTATERTLEGHRIDAVFSSWGEFKRFVRVPTLGWIHDFQHVHLPELFTPEENRNRDDVFAKVAAHSTRVVLSSEDALRDYAAFCPSYVHKARVLRFVAQPPADVYDGDPRQICVEYDLPERFVYLPNQFWLHKGHRTVVEALARLRSSRPEVTVVCTGNPSDHRAPLYFAELLAEASRLGLRDNFIVLGWVPHVHTFRLLRQSMAVLQPSRFEGWSTTVEETKSIGKTIVLSDIPIHREQAPPSALYFDPTDPAALAERLSEVYDTRAPGPDRALEADAREALPKRSREYAETFVDIVRDAVAAVSARRSDHMHRRRDPRAS